MKDTTYKMFNKLLMDDCMNDLTIRELSEEIDALKKENKNLKSKVSKLEKKLNCLKRF